MPGAARPVWRVLGVVVLVAAWLPPPAAAAHDHTGVVTIERLALGLPNVTTPPDWTCAVRHNLYAPPDVYVYCLPPEPGPGYCKDKVVKTVTVGANPRFDAVTWCTTGGSQARCKLAGSVAVTVNGNVLASMCTATGPATPNQIWLNEVACAVTYATGANAWRAECTMTVGHA